MANINMQQQSQLGPRVLIKTAVFCYRLVGGEHLWIPRAISSIMWVIGGLFLYLIVKKLFTPNAALVSTIFYLFAPFGIIASRSFQPDPMMVSLVVISIYTMLRYYDRPSLHRLVVAAIIAALPTIIKPPFGLVIFGAFVAMQIQTHGILRSIIKLDTYIYPVLTVLPGFIFYVVIMQVFKKSPAHGFYPHMLSKLYFWRGWVIMIAQTAGLIPFACAVAGIGAFRKKPASSLLAGMLAGNFVIGLMFPYQIHTHNYFELNLIPVAALALGPLALILVNRTIKLLKLFWLRLLVTAVVLTVAIIGVFLGISSEQSRSVNTALKNKISYACKFIWLNPGYTKCLYSDFSDTVATAEKIGELVNHSTKIFFLSSRYGLALKYHGEISGRAWPMYGGSFASKKIHNNDNLKPITNIENCFQKMCNDGKFIPEYFVLTDLDSHEFRLQVDLRKYLENKYPVLAKTDKYLIYDLRGR